MGIGPFVAVGGGTYVRADQVLAVVDGLTARVQFDLPSYLKPEPRSVILLRDGQRIPGYLTARTILARVAQALEDTRGGVAVG